MKSPYLFEHLKDLDGQLARRRDYKCAQTCITSKTSVTTDTTSQFIVYLTVEAVPTQAIELFQGRHKEGERLARACFRSAQEVTPC